MSRARADEPPHGVLLDVEGTTTPLAFVVDVLFPYARRHLRQHLVEHAASPAYEPLIEQLRQEHAADRSAGQAVPPWADTSPAERLESVQQYLEWLMDRDRKSTPMKTLQGKIWQEGYDRGELTGDVFSDVPVALQRWRDTGLVTAVFSSGSVLAQQLLFRHSAAGDLTPWLQHYFDTTIGAKTDAESYRRIAAALAMPARELLFISDVVRELDAARDAGMRTRLSIRPGNGPQPLHDHLSIHSFDEVC